MTKLEDVRFFTIVHKETGEVYQGNRWWTSKSSLCQSLAWKGAHLQLNKDGSMPPELSRILELLPDLTVLRNIDFINYHSPIYRNTTNKLENIWLKVFTDWELVEIKWCRVNE